jgi:hypothetical protein
MSRFGKKSAQQLEEEQRQLPAKPKEMLNTRRGRFTINPRQVTVAPELNPYKEDLFNVTALIGRGKHYGKRFKTKAQRTRSKGSKNMRTHGIRTTKRRRTH